MPSPQPVEGPWNPGIQSELPQSLLPLATIFRPENAFTTVAQVQDWQELTGLPLEQLVVFRPERLLVHELLIRVTGDISVDDGTKVEDLGINFRRITHTILTRHLGPRMPEILAAYDAARREIAQVVDAELSLALARPVPQATARPSKGPWMRCAGSAAMPASASAGRQRVGTRGAHVARLGCQGTRRRRPRAPRGVPRARANDVGGARPPRRVLGRRDDPRPARRRTGGNDHGAAAIGATIEPWSRDAALAEGFALLPAQAQPVVMNTKGASAAGKSTMRPRAEAARRARSASTGAISR